MFRKLLIEPVPVLSYDLDKGKGRVFDYGDKEEAEKMGNLKDKPEKLMAGAFKAFASRKVFSMPVAMNVILVMRAV